MATLNQHIMSRRGFCLCCVAATTVAASGGWLTPRQAFAEARNVVDLIRDEAAKAPIKVHKLRGNVSILEGSGGNIAVLTGADGKVFVDAGITASRLRILEAANGLSRDPVSHLINTHWHFDHTDGNQWLNSEGAAIIAHENTHKHLLVAQRVEDWDFNFPSSPLPAVPTETFASEKTLKLNASTLHLKYYGPAHTDSDVSVTIPEADVFHCGDTYWNGIYPFIDYSTSGNIDGMIKATEANVAAVTDKTIVIPGHGNPVSNKAELSAYRDMLVAIRDNVGKLKQQGRSLDETIAAKPTAAFDARWGQFVISPAFFTRLVYQGGFDMSIPEKPLHIDIPVILKDVKSVFSIGGLTFEGDLPASIFHLQLIANDIADANARSEVIAVFHTNAGHVTLHDVAYNADRNIATGNPYRELVANLIKRGVRIELCGATAKAHHWGNADLLPDIKVNTDAMARTTELVQQGFVKITE